MSRGVQRLLTGCLIAGTAIVAVWGYEPDGTMLPAGADTVVHRAFVLSEASTATLPVGVAAECPDPPGDPGGPDPTSTTVTTEVPTSGPPVTGTAADPCADPVHARSADPVKPGSRHAQGAVVRSRGRRRRWSSGSSGRSRPGRETTSSVWA